MIEAHFPQPAAPDPLSGRVIAAPIRHWLLVQLSLAVTGWAVILLGISCFV